MSRKTRRTVAGTVGGIEQSYTQNERQELHYYQMLKGLALSVFKWEGLPPEIDARFLELCLYENALAVFFYESTKYGAYFALRGSAQGKFNMYNNPTAFLATGADGFHMRLKNAFTPATGDRTAMNGYCVPIWANMLRTPIHNTIDLYARRLADIDRTVDVNLLHQKTPYIIECEESQRLTVINLYKQITGNEPVILVNKSLTAGTTLANVLDLKVPYVVGDLLTDKAKIWNEIMTFLGIDNANQDKKERLVADEVAANNGQIEVARLVSLNMRRQAADEINRRYGLQITVNYNHDIASANALYAADDAAQDGLDTETGSFDADL